MPDLQAPPGQGLEPGSSGGSSGQGWLPLGGPANPLALERQLLLVEEIQKESPGPPRLNKLIRSLLLILSFLGMGFLLFQETRRQWRERIAGLEDAIGRIEREKGRNERILEQVITQKDQLIRDKREDLARIETIHRGTVDELQLARTEGRRLQFENQDLIERLLREAGLPPLESPAPEDAPREAPAASREGSSESEGARPEQERGPGD